jgi:hypothetical protein
MLLCAIGLGKSGVKTVRFFKGLAFLTTNLFDYGNRPDMILDCLWGRVYRDCLFELDIVGKTRPCKN